MGSHLVVSHLPLNLSQKKPARQGAFQPQSHSSREDAVFLILCWHPLTPPPPPPFCVFGMGLHSAGSPLLWFVLFVLMKFWASYLVLSTPLPHLLAGSCERVAFGALSSASALLPALRVTSLVSDPQHLQHHSGQHYPVDTVWMCPRA